MFAMSACMLMAVVSHNRPLRLQNTNFYSGIIQDSTALIPGDIVNLSESKFNFFPADMFLLSGDTIVNESMLTGESVPVSKMPVVDIDLVRWRDSDDLHGDSAKSFLFSGTKIVRIRGALAVDGSTGRPALALVARTGERLDHAILRAKISSNRQVLARPRAPLFDRCCFPNPWDSHSTGTRCASLEY